MGFAVAWKGKVDNEWQPWRGPLVPTVWHGLSRSDEAPLVESRRRVACVVADLAGPGPRSARCLGKRGRVLGDQRPPACLLPTACAEPCGGGGGAKSEGSRRGGMARTGDGGQVARGRVKGG